MSSIPLVDIGEDLVVEREQLLQLRFQHSLLRQGDGRTQLPAPASRRVSFPCAGRSPRSRRVPRWAF